MTENSLRMTEKERAPDPAQLALWLGKTSYKRWTRLVRLIEKSYPGVFTPEWLYGGMKYGWGLRFKKSKSFCTLIPERRRFFIQIVFGGVERRKAEELLHDLSPGVRKAYLAATTYHDGKWLFLPVETDDILQDIETLLTVKRRPAVPHDAVGDEEY